MDERERLIEIMNSQGLNAKQLSLELGVSAGTISNIVGGRNKPSHDFLKGIAAVFPFISRDWLFMGEGDMYKPDYKPIKNETPDLFTSIELEKTTSSVHQPTSATTHMTSSRTTVVDSPIERQRSVQKIVIFYTDGTFEER